MLIVSILSRARHGGGIPGCTQLKKSLIGIGYGRAGSTVQVVDRVHIGITDLQHFPGIHPELRLDDPLLIPLIRVMGQLANAVRIVVVQLDLRDLAGDEIGRQDMNGGGSIHAEHIGADQRTTEGIFSQRPPEGLVHVVVLKIALAASVSKARIPIR